MQRNMIVQSQPGWVVPHAGGPGGPGEFETPPGGIDIHSVIRVINQWRWLLLGALALGLVAGVIATMVTTSVYRANVTIEVDPPSVKIVDDEVLPDSPSSGIGFMTTQVGLLTSRSTAERAAQQLNLANDPRYADPEASAANRLRSAAGALMGNLQVDTPRDGQLINFYYHDTDPQMAARIANQLANSFIDNELRRRYESSAYARQFLQGQIDKTREALEASEREAVAYAQKEGIISIGEDGAGGDTNSPEGNTLVQLNSALADATARRIQAETAYRQAQSVGTTTADSDYTRAAREQLVNLQVQYQQKSQSLRAEHPEMLALQAQIDETQRQIAAGNSQSRQGRANTLLTEYRAAQQAESQLRARVDALRGSVLNLRGRSIQYNILRREVDTNRQLYDALLQRYKEVGVASGVGSSPVSIVDRAEVPTAPHSPKLHVNLLYGAAAGLLLGFMLAFLLDFLYDMIKTREDVRTKLNTACLGVVPKTTTRDEFVDELQDPKSLLSEAYSSITASLRFSTDHGMPKMLMLSSARAGEGKSSSALALAQNSARRGMRVLLIDADMRKPAFKASADNVGLSRMLTDDRASLSGNTLKTQYDNLFLLPAGPIPPNPADLLATGRLQQILAEANELFDFVIIDGPPVLGLGDPLMLASAVGNVLFVIEAGKTRARAASEAVNAIRSTGAHLLGAILNKADEDVGGYGYSYGYGYGGGYGYGQKPIEEKRRHAISLTPSDDDDEPGEGEDGKRDA